MDTRKHPQSSEAVARAVRGSGGVTVPEGVWELWRCGTEAWLVGMVGLMILAIFSSLNDSMEEGFFGDIYNTLGLSGFAPVQSPC